MYCGNTVLCSNLLKLSQVEAILKDITQSFQARSTQVVICPAKNKPRQ